MSLTYQCACPECDRIHDRPGDAYPGLYEGTEDELTPFEFLTLVGQSHEKPAQEPLPGKLSVLDVLKVLQVAAVILGFTDRDLPSLAARIAARLAG